MKKLMFIFLTALFVHGIAAGEEKHRRRALQAGFGGITMSDNTPDGASFYFNDDRGNLFYLSGDSWLSQRLALTGQLFLEQNGILSDMSDGIGFKKIYMAGVQCGAKYYFFPKKWILQPHAGASLQVNVLNYGQTKGSHYYVAQQGYPGSQFRLDYDVQCPAMSAVPQIGFDLHLLSSVSLCFDFDARIGLWGHNRYNVLFIDGPLMGKLVPHINKRTRTAASVGLKIDIPVKKVSQKAQINLFSILGSWIQLKSGRQIRHENLK